MICIDNMRVMFFVRVTKTDKVMIKVSISVGVSRIWLWHS